MGRVLRIRQLQSVMGFNLEEIAKILAAEDRLAELQVEYRRGVGAKRTADIVGEVTELNARTQERVTAKIAVLEAFRAELETAANRYYKFAAEHGIALPSACIPPR